jgi:hemerythrin-like domain-containing protein
MKPRGPLMMEHRLIEKMLKAVEKEIARIKNDKKLDPVFIDSVVDFIRTYADRTHHGKEEDILFRELEKKKLSTRDDSMMRELIDEHKFARRTVGELVDAKKKYVNGDASALGPMIDRINVLTGFYPAHIQKEDKVFFPETEKYFSEAELKKMLDEFWAFDREMIHEKYKKYVQELEAR